MPSRELVESILNTAERTVDLSNQEGAVDYNVLEKARTALLLSDCFRALNLANNHLKDDCIPCIAAMIKDWNLIVEYDLTNCGITDQQITLHLIPALLRKRDVTTLILDKNPLTDECIDSLCKLFLETKLNHLSMIGIKLSPQAGWKLANAVEDADDVMTCCLPYSVGYQILDRIHALLKRNELRCNLVNSGVIINENDSLAPLFDSSPEEWNYVDKDKLYTYKKKKRRLAIALAPPGSTSANIGGNEMASTRQHRRTRSVLGRGSLCERRRTRTPSNLPPLNVLPPTSRGAPPSATSMISNNVNGTKTSFGFPFQAAANVEHSPKSTLKELFSSPPNRYAAHPRSMVNSLADPKIQQSLVSLYLLSQRSNLSRRQQNLMREKPWATSAITTKSSHSRREEQRLPAV